MNQQPDKLFRDKLYGYQKPVSSGLWNRIPATSARKAHSMLWMKIAAGLLLLATTSVLIFPVPRKAEPLTAQKEEPATKLPPPSNQGKELSEQSAKSETEKQASPPAPDHDQTPAQLRRGKESVNPRTKVKPETSRQTAETERTLSLRGEMIEAELIPAPEESVAVGPERETGNVTIILTLNEVNEKYLKKKNTIAEATSDEKETSGLRKLLDKASGLTYNQDPLGSLRQKKNEILALNLRGGKERNENHE